MTQIHNLQHWLDETIEGAVRAESFKSKLMRALDTIALHEPANRYIRFADVNNVCTPRFTGAYTLDTAQAGAPSVRCKAQFALAARKGVDVFEITRLEKSCRIYLTDPLGVIEEDVRRCAVGYFNDGDVLAKLRALSEEFRAQASHEEKFHNDLKGHIGLRAAEKIVQNGNAPVHIVKCWME